MNASKGQITPNLWFTDEAKDAAERYVSIFSNSRVTGETRYNPPSAEASGRPEGSVMSVEFELEGQPFVALNGGSTIEFNPAISFLVNCPTEQEVDDLWAKLTPGGEELMPLGSYPFSDRYGWTEDSFGVSWQVIHADCISERTIVPCLMFVGDRCGLAEEAMAFYTSVFDRAAVTDLFRYGPDQEPNEEGTVMFGDFTLRGQHFAAMDSAEEHDFDFNEAVSFIVDCGDQSEVDEYWDNLTANGGEEGRCGWLMDRYGVSWQVVPSILPALLNEPDPEGVRRVTQSLLSMNKIEIEPLQSAAESSASPP